MKTVIQDLTNYNVIALITWSLNTRRVHTESSLNEEKLSKEYDLEISFHF